MGQHGGGRFDGAQGSLRVRRGDAKKTGPAAPLMNLLANAVRSQVRELAEAKSTEAVRTLADLMVNGEDEKVRAACAREILKLADAYPNAKMAEHEARAAAGGVRVIIQNYSGELPQVVTAKALPPQIQANGSAVEAEFEKRPDA